MTRADLTAAASILAITLPLGLASGLAFRALRSAIAWIASWLAALPALALAIGFPAPPTLETRSVLLGVRIHGPDRVTQGFLLSAALLWFFTARFARAYLAESPRPASFWFFFLATMSGNVGVVLAQDVATFYLLYSVMTFAAYGLVVHERTDEATRAGRVYLVMALGGEALLLSAFWLIARDRAALSLDEVPAAVAAAPHRGLLVAMLLAGFAVKAGAVPLHVWLPLAHPVAPPPASAILSGALIKAGLLGWLRFLPLGTLSLPAHGALCVAIGVLTALWGAGLGAVQTEPKTVLAYSSVSQMGFMVCALGVALAVPSAADATTATLVLFALHHALAKGALFLGAAVAKQTGAGVARWLVAAGLSLPALAIAGAPLTSGALAKASLEGVIDEAPRGSTALALLLSVAAVGSTLAMVRFLSVALGSRTSDRRAPPLGMWLPWALLLLVAVGVFPMHPSFYGSAMKALLAPDALWSSAWPVITGVAIALAARGLERRGTGLPTVPAGDIVVPLESALRSIRDRRVWERLRLRAAGRHRPADSRPPPLQPLDWLARADAQLGAFRLLGALVLLFLALFVPLLLR